MATKSTRLADQLGNEVIPFHCHNLRRIDVYTICQEWGYHARDCDFYAFRPAALGQVVVDAEPDNIDTFRAWADAREAEAEIARAERGMAGTAGRRTGRLHRSGGDAIRRRAILRSQRRAL